jgi:hypothetical protein
VHIFVLLRQKEREGLGDIARIAVNDRDFLSFALSG